MKLLTNAVAFLQDLFRSPSRVANNPKRRKIVRLERLEGRDCMAADSIVTWNEIKSHALQNEVELSQSWNVAQPTESSVNIVRAAIRQAFDAVERGGELPAGLGNVQGALSEAAVARAAHDVLLAVLPNQQQFLRLEYRAFRTNIPRGYEEQRGIRIGAAIAQGIISSHYIPARPTGPAEPDEPFFNPLPTVDPWIDNDPGIRLPYFPLPIPFQFTVPIPDALGPADGSSAPDVPPSNPSPNVIPYIDPNSPQLPLLMTPPMAQPDIGKPQLVPWGDNGGSIWVVPISNATESQEPVSDQVQASQLMPVNSDSDVADDSPGSRTGISEEAIKVPGTYGMYYLPNFVSPNITVDYGDDGTIDLSTLPSDEDFTTLPYIPFYIGWCPMGRDMAAWTQAGLLVAYPSSGGIALRVNQLAVAHYYQNHPDAVPYISTGRTLREAGLSSGSG
jgi:hypothetical protein